MTIPIGEMTAIATPLTKSVSKDSIGAPVTSYVDGEAIYCKVERNTTTVFDGQRFLTEPRVAFTTWYLPDAPSHLRYDGDIYEIDSTDVIGNNIQSVLDGRLING